MTTIISFDDMSFLPPANPVISIAGAGGKTTLMFELAKVMPGWTVITTTTKVGADQIRNAGICRSLDEFSPKETTQTIWVSPSLTPQNGKITGCTLDEFSNLAELCRKNKITLINEADGAARKHIKAPADYEPVIPRESDICIYVIGMDVLGLPLNDVNVHRPEIFSAITGLSLGEKIDPDSIIRLLEHPRGGLKGMPNHAKKIVYLTHINNDEDFRIAEYINSQLNTYDYLSTDFLKTTPKVPGISHETAEQSPKPVKRQQRQQMVAIKGAGDLASGVALRLWRCGYRVIMSELSVPLCIRRTIAFSNAVFEGTAKVEEAESVLIHDISEAASVWEKNQLPVIVDETAEKILSLNPDVLIDARIIKTWRDDTTLKDAPLVIGMGPGFTAGSNAHCVIETNRGHNLGRVLWEGSAEPNTGVPGTIKGEGIKRVVKAPCSGYFHNLVNIGDYVETGDVIAKINETEIRSQLSGTVRGVIYPGIYVWNDLKIMDIDPRGNRNHCFTVSDKAAAIGGGVLEAILTRF